MDGQRNNQQDRQGHHAVVVLAVLFALTSTAFGQRLDVQPREKALHIDFTFQEKAQPFPPAIWEFRNAASGRGVLVSWELEAFQNIGSPEHRVDADVTVRLVRSGLSGRWRTTQEYDTTNVSQGRDSAIVSVTSSGRGRGSAELLVRFVTSDPVRVPSGTYHSTLTGTISGL